MFSNIGGLEVVFVMVLALIVLGPAKLPEAARQVGRVVTEVRRVSNGFQREFREAIQDPIVEAEARARGAVESTKAAVTEPFTAITDRSAPQTPTPDEADTKPSDEAAAPDETGGDG